MNTFSKKSNLTRILVIAIILMMGTFECFAKSKIRRVSGSIGDGPIVNATVKIYDKKNRLIKTTSSYKNATYLTNITVSNSSYPLTVKVGDGLDLVTNTAPDYLFSSVVMGSAIKYTNINPFSTMIVRKAVASGAVNSTNISAARQAVTTEMNFGLDPTIVVDPVTTQITNSNVAVITKASEAMGEMIRRVCDHMISGGTVIDGDAVMEALVSDLTDGVIDGVGGNQSNPKISALSKLVSAQVLIEAMSNNLKVQGEIATSRLDAAIMATHPTVSLAQLTDSVKIHKRMLDQTLKALYAAQALFSNTELRTLYATVSSIPADSLPADVEAILPAGSSDVLEPFITYLVSANNTEVTLVNKTTTIPVNNAPVISGTPATSVNANSFYSFQPSASDPDGNNLVFNVSGLPLWATFNSATGQISGMPSETNVGTYSNIVISVSDGLLSSSLPAFSIVVNKINNAPIISGTPSTIVTEGSVYTFKPNASDADGDTLTFSINNLPVWASFDTKTGILTGTPAPGTYSNIVISVSDGLATSTLPAFGIQVNAPANAGTGSITLNWTNPTVRVDNTTLSTTEIASSTVYYGKKSHDYTNSVKVDKSAATTNITGLSAGTYYIVMTTTDINGRESSYSQEVILNVQ